MGKVIDHGVYEGANGQQIQLKNLIFVVWEHFITI